MRLVVTRRRESHSWSCIVCVIGSIVTAAIIMISFDISRSAAMTVSHAEARDFARDGIARLSREIRDAEALPGQEAVLEAEANSIAFTTTFNREGNEVDSTKPRLVRYWYDMDKLRLYRDAYGVDVTDLSESPDYERRDVVIPYLLNSDESPLFNYTYIDGSGVRLPATGDDDLIRQVLDGSDRARILLVGIHALVDLDPGKGPERYGHHDPGPTAQPAHP